MQELPNTENSIITLLAIAHSMVKQADANVTGRTENAEEKLDRLLEAFDKAYRKVFEIYAGTP